LQTKDLQHDEVKKLGPLMAVPGYDFWVTPKVGRGAQIMVSPEQLSQLKITLTSLNLEPQVLIEDVGM
jgi:hypothetical protein